VLHDAVVTPSWRLEAASKGDFESLFEIHRAAMREYVEATWGQWDDERQKQLFADNFDLAGWQLVDVAGEVAGLVSWEERPRELWLAAIEIHPRFQRKGLGTAIIGSLVERARAGGKPVTLRVLHANTEARSLYERLGFREFRRIETHAYFRLDPVLSPGPVFRRGSPPSQCTSCSEPG
jgi:ribosomal protein S18 acetylase RimI-like enzyme